jgi:transmembrane sensor
MIQEKEQNDYVNLIIRYLSNDTTPAENKLFSEWLQVSDENRIYFNSIRDIWLASAQVDPDSVRHAEKRFFLPEEGKEKEVFHGKSPSWGYKITGIIRFAAIIVVALFTGALGYKYFLSGKQAVNDNRLMTVEAMMGSKAVTTLPDGTRVWLNAGSKLSYAGKYGIKSREVNLSGEAYFDVVTNPSKPFVVKAGNLAIKAFGTQFNVKAYPEDRSIVTTLVKGKVVIEGKDKMQQAFTIHMKPHESVAYYIDESINTEKQAPGSKSMNSNVPKASGMPASDNKPSVTKGEVNTELFTSWKDERWIIEKQPLGVLSRDFERRYNIKINITSDIISKYHFTGTIQNETIEQLLVILRHTIPLKYTIDKGSISIYEDTVLMKEFRSINRF